MNENDVESRITTCFVDAGMKIGCGAAIGLLISALFTKRRAWPFALGAGLGLGLAYTNCEKSLNTQMKKACLEPIIACAPKKPKQACKKKEQPCPVKKPCQEPSPLCTTPTKHN